MQTRPYPEKDGRRIWLTREDVATLLEAVDDEPRRRIALQLGLHGLRTDEIVHVQPTHLRDLAGESGHALVVPDGKTGKRELPISGDLHERIHYLTSAAQLRKDEEIVNVGKRQVRNWLEDARAAAAVHTGAPDGGPWSDLGMHDLRRTWATDGYYSLAFAGVPIAEQLVMAWGGWAQTESGRDTFRQSYLGPVPDHVTQRAVGDLALP